LRLLLRQTAAPRNGAIDLLRAVSILYIVGFWHLLGYAPSVSGYKNALTHRLTVVVLGLFVLISGHLIGRASIRDGGDIARFYRRRLIRIYPPYVLALLLFTRSGLLDSGQLLPAILLTSSFGADPPRTLWYIAMLVVFYLLAPFLLLLRERLAPGGTGPASPMAGLLPALALALALIVASVGMARLAAGGDPRLFLYFSPFVVGLLVSARLEVESLSRRSILLVVGLAMAAVLQSLGSEGGELDTSLAGIPLATLPPLALLILCQRGLPELRLSGVVMAMSTASYFMYLFHRPIFHVLTTWGRGPISSGPVAAVTFLVVVCLPVIVALSWLGQRLYDRLVRAFQLPGRA
jgi:peptidoglycan/LPS O-acetylase OafA/YrhL